MSISTDTIVGIGPKSDDDRLYEITQVGQHVPSYLPNGSTRVITLVRITDGTTWQARVKSGAKRIPWNTRLMRVTTDADRRESIRKDMEDLAITTQSSDVKSCHCGEPARADGSDYDGTVCHRWPICEKRSGVPKVVCECVYSCAEDPATSCSLSGDWHVHPGEACPVHPYAPGDDVHDDVPGGPILDDDEARAIAKNTAKAVNDINERNGMTDQLNISDRVKWSEYVDEGPAITREGEVFQFVSRGFVEVNFREGTVHTSRTIHRDRLTKI